MRTLGFPTSLCDRNVMDDELINKVTWKIPDALALIVSSRTVARSP
ncbi:MAG: hypothetical protein V3U46_01415 [Acidimicrobiia bacterium]